MMKNLKKIDRKFALQLLLLQCGLLFLVVIAHLSVLHTVRSMEASQFIKSHRNDIVSGNWRRVELSGDFLNGRSFESIRLIRHKIPREQYMPGKITRKVFLDDSKHQAFGEIQFRYDNLHNSGFSLLFLLMIDMICLAIMFVVRKQLDKQVRQEQEVLRLRSITQSVQMIAHDVRKPFFMVNGILDGISSNEFSDPKELENLITSAKRVSGQIDDMLADVLALDSKVKIVQTSISPRDLFMVSKAIVNLRFPHISFSINENTPTLFVDSTKLQRVFTNIMMNAAEAMKGDGKIWCDVLENDEHSATIQLGNTNSYIPSEKCERIFLPFYSGEESKGSGLGLAIVKHIVEAHGGTITVRSSKKEGTIFTMTLPLASEPQEQVEQAEVSGSLRIAVVEDCPLTLFRWKKLLATRASYFTAPNDFFASIQPHDAPYNLVITDFFFDNDVASGYDLGKRIKQTWPECEVILTTNDLSQSENELFSRVVDKQDIGTFITERFGSLNA